MLTSVLYQFSLSYVPIWEQILLHSDYNKVSSIYKAIIIKDL